MITKIKKYDNDLIKIFLKISNGIMKKIYIQVFTRGSKEVIINPPPQLIRKLFW